MEKFWLGIFVGALVMLVNLAVIKWWRSRDNAITVEVSQSLLNDKAWRDAEDDWINQSIAIGVAREIAYRKKADARVAQQRRMRFRSSSKPVWNKL